MVDINAIMKQAQKMQERLQKQMAEMRVEGTSGGGMQLGSHETASRPSANRIQCDGMRPVFI